MAAPTSNSQEKTGRTPSMFASVLVFGVMIGLILLIWPEGTARFGFFFLGSEQRLKR